MKTLYLIFCVFIFSSSIILAQGYIVKSGENAFLVGGDFRANEDATGIGGGLGYNINGIVSMSFQVGHISADEGDLSNLYFGPFATIYPVKYSSDVPVTVALSVGYIFENYSSDILDQNNLDLTGNNFWIWGGFYFHIPFSPTGQIIPALSFEYDFASIMLEDNFGNSVDDDDEFSYLTVFIGVSFDTSPSSFLSFGPRVTFGLSGEGNDKATFGLGIGLGFKN